MKLNISTSNYKLWIAIAIITKGVFFWTQIIFNYPANQPLLGIFVHDSHEYYDSMNSFYETGVYTPDVRMPGLGIIFLLLRFLFERNTVLDIILVLQWLTSSVCIYVLARTVSKMIKKDTVFFFVFFLLIATHYIFLWDVLLLTESFCISFFIFSLYFLQRFLETPSKKLIFWAGFFLTWCVFLRPIFLLFYGVISIFLFIRFVREKRKFREILIYGILFLGLFTVLDGIWTVRNMQVKDRFLFLNDIDSYSELSSNDPMPAIYFFLEAWGGDLEDERHWFEADFNIDYHNRDTILPDFIYTSKFNKDSLRFVKGQIQIWKKNRSDSMVNVINTTLQRYTNSIRTEKPFLFYVVAGFINYKKMIWTGYCNRDLINSDFGKLPFTTKLYRLSRAILFYLIFFIGAIYSLFYLFSRNKNPLMKTLIVIAHVNLLYIAFFFRTAEFRYVLPSTVIFMCLTAILMNNLWEKYKGRSISAKQ
jgi:hypothetical protein